MKSAMICSDSREAVPFPREMRLTPYFFTREERSERDSRISCLGAVG